MRVALVSVAVFSFFQALIFAESGPQPPCGVEASPPYPELDRSPVFKVWDRNSIGRDWVPPDCLGWPAPGFATLVTTVGRFRYSESAEDLLERVGRISGLTGIRYWSTTRQHWAPLIVSASALTGPEGAHHRQDFSLAELMQGSTLYFQQSDNTAGKASYQLRIMQLSPDRLSFQTENITAMRYLLVPIFPPHEFQASYFLERESQEVWRYYSIARTGKNANGLANGHDASIVNRAMAFFRYVVGIPTDQEPPAAR